LLVGAHPDFKVHVHTNEPGTVLTYMTERGQVSEVHIHNMRLQSAERSAQLEQEALGATGAGEGFAVDEKNYGFVAVASGTGMERILKSLGVDVVVSGGQTMNPSTGDLLDAVEKVRAEHVFILPNNKNIILTANAAAENSERPIKVIPTKSVPQSFSALFVADQSIGFDENAALMTEAIASVHIAEVTAAIKDAKAANGVAIHGGDIIGILGDAIEAVGTEVGAVALQLIGLLAQENVDTLTILAGEDFPQADFEELLETIENSYPDLEIDAHRGEQPLYPLVMAAE
jgi:dihydroxyacetone kinase-like predicted kinase